MFSIRFIVLVLVSMLLTAGCATNPATGRSQLSLMSMSTEKEIEIGKSMFPQVLQKMGGTYPDKELATYVQRVGERLKSASYRSGLNFTFKVVNDSTPNAFAMPGGYIAITRGLLTHLENEAQLAAVLGHEIGHVDARHAVQGMQRSSLLNIGLAVLSGATGTSQYSGLINTSGEIAATLVDRSYSRDQEEESDRLGIDYMAKTGYDPNGAVELQQIFFRKIEGGKEAGWLEGMFRTHPFSRKRMEQNQEYIAANYGRTPSRSKSSNSEFLLITKRLRDSRAGYALYEQARVAEKKEDDKKAIALYLQAAAAAPDEALILSHLGIAYLRAGDLVSARRHLQHAARLDSEYFQTQLGLSYMYLNEGDAGRTIQHARKSFNLLPTLEGAYLLARGFDANGETEKALEYYRAVEKTDPRSKMGKHAAARIVVLEGNK